MEKKIVILENNWKDYQKIREYFPGYSYYPDVQNKTSLLEFLQDIIDALNNKLPEHERKTIKENVISAFQKNCENVFAYIIDYELKENNNVFTGLEFHKLFIHGDYKKIYTNKDMPCIMPTKMTGNRLRYIDNYKKVIDNSSLFDYTYKPNKREDDTEYKRKLQNFVENANPRLKLAKHIRDKITFNDCSKEVQKILDDIITNCDSYKDEIDNILDDCIHYNSNRDKKYTNQLIQNLKNGKSD